MSDFDDTLTQVEEQPRFQVIAALLLDSAAYNRAATLQAELDLLLPRLTAAKTDDDDITDVSPMDRARHLAAELVDLHDTHPPRRFIFQALPAETFSDLDAKHPGDRKMGDDFWLHLMAASCVEPEGATVDGWRRWRKTLNAGQFDYLRRRCEEANLGAFDLGPTRAASVLANGLRQNSGQPEPTG